MLTKSLSISRESNRHRLEVFFSPGPANRKTNGDTRKKSETQKRHRPLVFGLTAYRRISTGFPQNRRRTRYGGTSREKATKYFPIFIIQYYPICSAVGRCAECVCYFFPRRISLSTRYHGNGAKR